MNDIEHIANEVKRKIDTLQDVIKYYSSGNKEQALLCLDDAKALVIKAKIYASMNNG